MCGYFLNGLPFRAGRSSWIPACEETFRDDKKTGELEFGRGHLDGIAPGGVGGPGG
jgi:hypothetical protein